jgi:putative ABC transport system permease protein
MRLMGSTPTQLFLLIMTEAILLTTIGYLLGIVASRCALYALGQQLAQNFNDNINAFFKPQPHELWLAAACLCIAFVAAIVPAVVAYRTPIALRLSAS